MIKFFRKIRQKLIVEGKLNKYLFYALGEIILVIIGILIALQINNWNQIEKSKAESERLLNLLVLDLEKDIGFLNSIRAEYNDWLLQIEDILNNTLDNSSKKVTQLHEFSAGRTSMYYLHVNKTTFMELFNSGKNLEFENVDIVRDIKNYYEYADIELNKLNSDNEIYFRQAQNLYGNKGFSTWFRLYYQRNLEHIDWSWLTDPNSDEYERLEAMLLYYKLSIEVSLELIQELETRANLLIDKVKNEIG